jgi:glyoxylase-like metal-dependent hydrolase (beta-lactamase superfamily II)
MIARSSAPALLCILAFTPFARTAAADDQPLYTVDAIRYGTLADFPVRGLVQGADASRKMDIAMVVWLVRGGGHNILVDAGFYRAQFFQHWNVKDFKKPSEAIAAEGLQPTDITDVIVTHLHWDHADGADLFPKARIWVQRDEFVYYTGEAWHNARTHGGIEPDDVMSFAKMNIDGRVAFVAGDAQEILPGITCYIGGKHTYASQYVGVRTAKGIVILASDNVYLYENLEKHLPISQSLDQQSNLRAQDRMRKLAAEERLIVPGHDPAQFTRFHGPAPTVVRIE